MLASLYLPRAGGWREGCDINTCIGSGEPFTGADSSGQTGAAAPDYPHTRTRLAQCNSCKLGPSPGLKAPISAFTFMTLLIC